MALPIALSAVLAPMFMGLGRIMSGVAIAALTYQFLSSMVWPVINTLLNEVTETVSGLNEFGPMISFFDVPHLISVVLSAYVAAFTIKLAIRAIAAYGVASS